LPLTSFTRLFLLKTLAILFASFLSLLLDQLKSQVFAQSVNGLDATTAAVHYTVQDGLVNAGLPPNLIATVL
jgi:hypothetical protein